MESSQPWQSIGALLLISFWIYCSRKTKKHELNTSEYMWLVAFVWGVGLFGMAIYDYYRRKQLYGSSGVFFWRKKKTPPKDSASKRANV